MIGTTTKQITLPRTSPTPILARRTRTQATELLQRPFLVNAHTFIQVAVMVKGLHLLRPSVATIKNPVRQLLAHRRPFSATIKSKRMTALDFKTVFSNIQPIT